MTTKQKLIVFLTCAAIVIGITAYNINNTHLSLAPIKVTKIKRTSIHLETDKPRSPNIYVSDYEAFYDLERVPYRLTFKAKGHVVPFTLNCTARRDWRSLIAVNVDGDEWKEFITEDFIPEGPTISIFFILEDKGTCDIEDLKLEKAQ